VGGQFTQEDPIGLAGGMNLYGYANGDPINFSDPFGLSPDGGVLTGPVLVGLGAAAITSVIIITQGEELSSALDQGLRAGMRAAENVVASVKSKLRKLGEITSIVIGGLFGDPTPVKNDELLNPTVIEQVIPAPAPTKPKDDEDEGDTSGGGGDGGGGGS
jgi:uncharacterized protein RhaS with RHS repeats